MTAPPADTLLALAEQLRAPECPFCGRDPFHYVDNGVGMEAVAVTCCDLGDAYFRGMRPDPETVTIDWADFVKIGDRLATPTDRRGVEADGWNEAVEACAVRMAEYMAQEQPMNGSITEACAVLRALKRPAHETQRRE